MDLLKYRFFRLFKPAKSTEELAQQIDDLRHVLFSTIQDVVVLKEMLQQKGVWDEALYKELRTNRMISDHSGAGASPWVYTSFYPYTLDEVDFLRHKFRANHAEIKQFEDEVDFVSKLT